MVVPVTDTTICQSKFTCVAFVAKAPAVACQKNWVDFKVSGVLAELPG